MKMTWGHLFKYPGLKLLGGLWWIITSEAVRASPSSPHLPCPRSAIVDGISTWETQSYLLEYYRWYFVMPAWWTNSLLCFRFCALRYLYSVGIGVGVGAEIGSMYMRWAFELWVVLLHHCDYMQVARTLKAQNKGRITSAQTATRATWVLRP